MTLNELTAACIHFLEENYKETDLIAVDADFLRTKLPQPPQPILTRASTPSPPQKASLPPHPTPKPPVKPPVQKPPPPEPVPPRPQTEKKATHSVEKTEKRDYLDLSDVRAFFSASLPEIKHIERIPDDALVRLEESSRKLDLSRAKVVLLSFNTLQKQQTFLAHLSLALCKAGHEAVVASAHKLEQEDAWETIASSTHHSLILASDYAIYTLPGLTKHVKGSPGSQHIGNTPLFLMSDLSIYMKEPQLKSALWKALNQHLCTQNMPLSS